MGDSRPKVELDVDSLFGLEYWPPIPAFLVSTADAAGKAHALALQHRHVYVVHGRRRRTHVLPGSSAL